MKYFIGACTNLAPAGFAMCEAASLTSVAPLLLTMRP
jgi:hypothetical protein